MLILLLSIVILTNAQDLPYPDEMGCMPSADPTADCYGASLVATSAINEFRPQGCNTNADCYHMREPPEWCRLAINQAWRLDSVLISNITFDLLNQSNLTILASSTRNECGDIYCSKEGCHCDPKLSICVVDRITQTSNGGFMEYTYCYPSQYWFCPQL
uniref:Phlebovirus glycoprotein G2 fusion domain-containing protein n=1 Tax=Ascaris lumbricoides TaxID=6252 RepID=A0A0M3IB27_ASCLU